MAKYHVLTICSIFFYILLFFGFYDKFLTLKDLVFMSVSSIIFYIEGRVHQKWNDSDGEINTK